MAFGGRREFSGIGIDCRQIRADLFIGNQISWKCRRAESCVAVATLKYMVSADQLSFYRPSIRGYC